MIKKSIAYEIDCTPCEYHQKIPGTSIYKCMREFNYKENFFKGCPKYIKKKRIKVDE